VAGGATLEELLLEDLAELEHRPYDFVMWAFPWGEAGTHLEKKAGPQGWQKRLLLDLQAALLAGEKNESGLLSEAFQAAVKSGHDVGKSAVLSWLVLWGVTTKVGARGRVTANTEKQLTRTLWPEVAKWHNMFIAKDLFEHSATAYTTRDPNLKISWRCDAIAWSEDNSEAFQGLHNEGNRLFVIFEEASGIADVIWNTIDGAMFEGETELIWIACGNPTRATGRFRQCFEDLRDFWHTYTVDSRDVPWTNKDRINRAIALYGEDSDYVKVRFLGQFPDLSSNQLFPLSLLREAESREAQSQPWEPLILAVDVARFGPNESVLLFRRGKDARTIPAQRYRQQSTVDLANKIALAISIHAPDAVFIDEGGIGGGVIDHLRFLGHHVIGVQFGGNPGGTVDGVKVLNKRAEMYVTLLHWLQNGGAIPSSRELEDALVAIEYFYQKKTELLQLIAKEDIDNSDDIALDWADALAISFAFPVAAAAWKGRTRQAKTEYDPFAQDAFSHYQTQEYH
jgi:hypothetical protein